MWDWWDVETKGQFAASCFAVIVAVIVYRGLVKLEQRFIRYAVMLGSPARRGGNLQGLELGECSHSYLPLDMILSPASLLLARRGGALVTCKALDAVFCWWWSAGTCMTGASLLDLDDGTESTYRGPIVIPFWCRLVQAVFSGLLYGYALLLMLVAMAYNPGLFLSLMAGWVIGELLFPTSFDAVAASLHAGKAAACCDR